MDANIQITMNDVQAVLAREPLFASLCREEAWKRFVRGLQEPGDDGKTNGKVKDFLVDVDGDLAPILAKKGK